MNLELARFNMIEQQIRPWNVLDPAVLSLLAVVRREDFVPAAYRALAFVDCEVPLPEGQCMLAPKVEARLLQEAGVQRHERVLEVGAGSGFMAALLAHRARSVLSLELHAEPGHDGGRQPAARRHRQLQGARGRRRPRHARRSAVRRDHAVGLGQLPCRKRCCSSWRPVAA